MNKKPKSHRREARYVSILAVRIPDANALIDMLRYDSCFPSTEVEAGKILRIMGRHAEPADRLVRLTRVSSSDGPPSYARWRSFGCTVLDVRSPDESPISDSALGDLAAESSL